MKALLIDRDMERPLLLPPEMLTFVDSAITAHARPVFLPDFDNEWIAEFYMAIKVSRLGKNIAPKFAPRYIESATVAMRLVPVTTDSELMRAVRPRGVVGLFDNALTPGEWLPFDGFSKGFSVAVNDVKAEVRDFVKDASEALSVMSEYATLKTGDLIMPYRVVPSVSVRTGSIIDVKIDDQPVLSLKIH